MTSMPRQSRHSRTRASSGWAQFARTAPPMSCRFGFIGTDDRSSSSASQTPRRSETFAPTQSHGRGRRPERRLRCRARRGDRRGRAISVATNPPRRVRDEVRQDGCPSRRHHRTVRDRLHPTDLDPTNSLAGLGRPGLVGSRRSGYLTMKAATNETLDFAVIGAGIAGTFVAREVLRCRPDWSIVTGRAGPTKGAKKPSRPCPTRAVHGPMWIDSTI